MFLVVLRLDPTLGHGDGNLTFWSTSYLAKMSRPHSTSKQTKLGAHWETTLTPRMSLEPCELSPDFPDLEATVTSN